MEARTNAQTLCAVDNLSPVGHVPDQLSVCVPVCMESGKADP